MMKKGYVLVIAALGVIAGIYMKMRAAGRAISISIIGGADGPTSIFIAGKVGNDKDSLVFWAAVVTILIITAIFAIIIANSKNKK